MNFAEMFGTTGGILFYGGIMGMGVSVILGLLFVPISVADKKRVIKKINSEFQEENEK